MHVEPGREMVTKLNISKARGEGALLFVISVKILTLNANYMTKTVIRFQ